MGGASETCGTPFSLPMQVRRACQEDGGGRRGQEKLVKEIMAEHYEFDDTVKMLRAKHNEKICKDAIEK